GLASLGTQYEGVQDGGVHRAGFYVLVGARMPAVLFETSYISNSIDEQRLGSADYQQRLADGIANPVKAFRQGRSAWNRRRRQWARFAPAGASARRRGSSAHRVRSSCSSPTR